MLDEERLNLEGAIHMLKLENARLKQQLTRWREVTKEGLPPIYTRVLCKPRFGKTPRIAQNTSYGWVDDTGYTIPCIEAWTFLPE